ncbi:MAG: tyrosine-type recombinase/integrase [Bacteroidales bacterium]|nr:tyrosine-type recombinase/integrase [Bacteroidales bacterium]
MLNTDKNRKYVKSRERSKTGSINDYLKENYSKTSITGYLWIIDRFKQYTQNHETASYQDILNYISYLRKKQLHPKTIRNNLFAIKIYYRYLISIGKRTDHPANDLYLQDKINRSIDVENLYTKKQLEEFYKDYKPKRKELLQRDKTIISLLIYQALTVLEISQLEINNLDLEKGLIHIKANAKNNSRTLNLESSQIMLMHNYINQYRKKLLKQNQNKETEALILSLVGTRIAHHSISRQLNYKREKHERLLPLKIRQSVIANLLKSGNDLRIVQVFAGHRRAASTEEYKQTGLEELKNAINKYHPLQ